MQKQRNIKIIKVVLILLISYLILLDNIINPLDYWFGRGLEKAYGIIKKDNEEIIKKSTYWGKWEYLWVGEIKDYGEYMERQDGNGVKKLQVEEKATTLNTQKKKVPMVALYKFRRHSDRWIEISFYQDKDTYVACYCLHPKEEAEQ